MEKNNNGYNFWPVQVNEVIDRTADGTIMKKSLMLNIRSESPEQAVELYRGLKEELNDGINQSEDQEKIKAPMCPVCEIPMVLRQNSRNGNRFFSCRNWRPDRNGCNETKPYVVEKEETAEKVPF